MATVLLTGDVMIGRGIDQILEYPSSPEIYETYCRSALVYVALAEARSGPIPRGAACDYVWGDALEVFRGADLRIINLETAVTCCDAPAPKGINYRCHPANLPCLTAAGIDCCVLANNHVLDWGEQGLVETLDALEAAGLAYAAAGRDIDAAEAPANLSLPELGRVLVYAMGASSSGVPHSWAAGIGRPGVSHLDDPAAAARRLSARIAAERQSGDMVVVSIHWGPNWGHSIPEADRRFAHRLFDEAGVDIVHGHSSHHPKAIELYRGRPILYGCGDFLNDYEGIGGEQSYRPDLVLAYMIETTPSGSCSGLALHAFRVARFRLNRASREEADWLAATLDRESRQFGARVTLDEGRGETCLLRVKSADA